MTYDPSSELWGVRKAGDLLIYLEPGDGEPFLRLEQSRGGPGQFATIDVPLSDVRHLVDKLTCAAADLAGAMVGDRAC